MASNSKTWEVGSNPGNLSQSAVQIHLPNSLIPESGKGLYHLVVYSRDWRELSSARGVATGVEWSLGTPYVGSSGGTGGVITGTLYRE